MKGLTSALWVATLNGSYDRANRLICIGANVNQPGKTKYDPVTTLLHYATAKNDVQRMRLLINHDANCNAPDSLKRTPLHWAAMTMDEDRPDVVEVLIDGGAIVDARDIHQSTPLLLAAFAGRCQSVEMLIARGASIEAVDKNGSSALHMVTKSQTFNNQLKMIKMLISLKINIDTEDHSGQTPLHLALTWKITDSVSVQ